MKTTLNRTAFLFLLAIGGLTSCGDRPQANGASCNENSECESNYCQCGSSCRTGCCAPDPGEELTACDRSCTDLVCE